MLGLSLPVEENQTEKFKKPETGGRTPRNEIAVKHVFDPS